jgi:hypothetical protein
MWLLDANMDVHLVQTLGELGVSSDTAANRGLKALSNGELVSEAVAQVVILNCQLPRGLTGVGHRIRRITKHRVRIASFEDAATSSRLSGSADFRRPSAPSAITLGDVQQRQRPAKGSGQFFISGTVRARNSRLRI